MIRKIKAYFMDLLLTLKDIRAELNLINSRIDKEFTNSVYDRYHKDSRVCGVEIMWRGAR